MEERLAKLERLPASQAGRCDFCAVTFENTLMLVLTIGGGQLTLCPFHEGTVLITLINNYVKRKKKKQSRGFSGDIPKESSNEAGGNDGSGNAK